MSKLRTLCSALMVTAVEIGSYASTPSVDSRYRGIVSGILLYSLRDDSGFITQINQLVETSHGAEAVSNGDNRQFAR
jgi:hypothetical protein